MCYVRWFYMRAVLETPSHQHQAKSFYHVGSLFERISPKQYGRGQVGISTYIYSFFCSLLWCLDAFKRCLTLKVLNQKERTATSKLPPPLQISKPNLKPKFNFFQFLSTKKLILYNMSVLIPRLNHHRREILLINRIWKALRL